MTTARDFVTRQLGTAGWAPIHAEAAKFLDSDTANEWRTFQAWQNTPSVLPRQFPGAVLYKAKISGFGEVLILSRSDNFLVERMGWLGLAASSVVAEKVDVPRTTPPAPVVEKPTPQQIRLGKLRALANQELPPHDCDLRREVLAARAELEQLA